MFISISEKRILLPQKTIADFVGLLKSAVEGKPYHGSQINWREILRLSTSHRVDNLIFEAISMLPDEEKPAKKVLERLEQDSITQVIQDANQISETEELMAEFEQHQIHAIMLKGWIMKELYPRTDLRSRADTDIFIHTSDQEKIHHIILSHGFQTVTYGGKKDNVYEKEPFVTLEMHKNLFAYEDDWNEVIFDDLKDTPENNEREPYTGVTLIFAKEPQGGPYIFRGAYVENTEKTGPKHYVSTRVGTKIKLIGQPSENIEILDDFRNKG